MATFEDRLDAIEARFGEIDEELSDPAVYDDREHVQDLSQEQARLREVVETARRWRSAHVAAGTAGEMARSETEAEIVVLAEEEEHSQRAVEEEAAAALHKLLLPRDPKDDRDVVVEIRAGTGGDEAALFAADLFRMYGRYAERQRWPIEVMESSGPGPRGFKQVVFEVHGQGAYSRLKFESGVHRVQRVPETESQGRIHTSAASVVVLPEADEVDVDIAEADIKTDVFRSTGPGGQSVNTTDSAVRITHLPTGLVVTCQDEKSQHKNKAKALRVLRARLFDLAEAERQADLRTTRRSMVGSGDRSEKIRTYNFPQSRITDHRIGLDIHQLARVLDGELDPILDALLEEDQARRLLEADGSGGT
ncbi:MAG: peptide chain release factor 1 [Candidatus Dormibacteria bacterium]